jgi:hypothetical protein
MPEIQRDHFPSGEVEPTHSKADAWLRIAPIGAGLVRRNGFA